MKCFLLWFFMLQICQNFECRVFPLSSAPIGNFVRKLNNATFDIVNVGMNVLDIGAGVVRHGLNSTANILTAKIRRIVNKEAPVPEIVKLFLKETRALMQTGMPEMGIPILEPLVIDRIDLNLTHEVGKFSGNIEHVKVKGLSKFNINYADFNVSQMALLLNLSFPLVEITGNYDIYGNMGKMFVIVGKGPFWIKAFNVVADVTALLRVNTTKLIKPHLYLKSLDVDVKLTKLKNKFDNLMNNEEVGDFFNRAIEEIGPEAFSYIWPKLKPAILKRATEYINEALRHLNLRNVLPGLFRPVRRKLSNISIHD